MAFSGIPVLNYHAIDDTGKEYSTVNVSVRLNDFREQINWLHEEGYTSITIEELDRMLVEKIPPSEKRVLITFDDGYESLHKHGLEILSANNFNATLFLSTSFIGKKYDQSDFYFVSHDRQLTWPEIRDLIANGWSIQSHGYTHRKMAHLDVDSIAREVTVSKDILEQTLGRPIDAFAYPYGCYNKNVVDQLRMAGYQRAFSVHSGKLFASSPTFQLPRIEINSGDSMESFKAKVTTGYSSRYINMRAKIRDILFSNVAVKDMIEKYTHRMGYGCR
jgi:peptidoglycan/xylan/chitin deacetylase (PgdA/CDA1 family)